MAYLFAPAHYHVALMTTPHAGAAAPQTGLAVTSTAQRRNTDTANAGSTTRFHSTRWLTLALAVVAIVIGEIFTWFLLRSQGTLISGDSPHYLIAAETLSHLSVHVLPQYRADLVSHYIYAWPQGATLSTMGVHAFTGPHGVIFAQGIGLPVLLAPFIAVGNVPLALVAFFTVNAIGFVYIHQRASRLAELGRNGQVVFALALACPALWLAATQIYPDLISGIFLACGLIEMALVERSGICRWTSVAVITVALAVPPWFQIKNFSVDVVAIVGLLVLVYLRRIELVPGLVVIGVVIVSFAAPHRLQPVLLRPSSWAPPTEPQPRHPGDQGHPRSRLRPRPGVPRPMPHHSLRSARPVVLAPEDAGDQRRAAPRRERHPGDQRNTAHRHRIRGRGVGRAVPMDRDAHAARRGLRSS